jgi:septum formation protein
MAEKHLKLILASQSPRRRDLLTEAGYEFEVIPSEVDETLGICSQCGPAHLVVGLAVQKAADVARRLHPDPERAECLIVACDTVAECGGQILGKPRDEDHAREMLGVLSGQVHRVYSGLCVWPLTHGAPHVETEISTLRMDPLTASQLEDYLASGLWEGKAGAFGYQDQPGWIHLINGSESNVVGLPMELLAKMLERYKTKEPVRH